MVDWGWGGVGLMVKYKIIPFSNSDCPSWLVFNLTSTLFPCHLTMNLTIVWDYCNKVQPLHVEHDLTCMYTSYISGLLI